MVRSSISARPVRLSGPRPSVADRPNAAGCAIDSPGGLRALIEAVYGDDAEATIPDGLLASRIEADGRAGAEQGIANYNVLDFTRGYMRDAGAWDSDVRTPTRLDDSPQVTLRLARVVDGRIEPYAFDAAPDDPFPRRRRDEPGTA